MKGSEKVDQLKKAMSEAIAKIQPDYYDLCSFIKQTELAVLASMLTGEEGGKFTIVVKRGCEE